MFSFSLNRLSQHLQIIANTNHVKKKLCCNVSNFVPRPQNSSLPSLEKKKRTIWPSANGWYSANPTAELTVVVDKKGVGEGRPITSAAQTQVVIGLHILVDAIV